jgi:carboxymethylenebutenolidase
VSRWLSTCDVAGHPVAVEGFAPAGDDGPTAVLLHGRDGPDGGVGDWTYREAAAQLAGAGVRVLFPHYFDRTAAHPPPVAGSDLDAVGSEVERFGLWVEAVGAAIRAAGPGPVGVVGYSLGGYLALTAAMTGPGVRAVAAWSAGVPTPFAGLAGRLPPALVLHGTADAVVPEAEAAALVRLLRRRGVPSEVRTYPGAGHRFGAADAADAVGRVAAFLGRHLDESRRRS